MEILLLPEQPSWTEAANKQCLARTFFLVQFRIASPLSKALIQVIKVRPNLKNKTALLCTSYFVFPPLTGQPGHASRSQTGIRSSFTCGVGIATVAVLKMVQSEISPSPHPLQKIAIWCPEIPNLIFHTLFSGKSVFLTLLWIMIFLKP